MYLTLSISVQHRVIVDVSVVHSVRVFGSASHPMFGSPARDDKHQPSPTCGVWVLLSSPARQPLTIVQKSGIRINRGFVVKNTFSVNGM